ncbi:MAG: M56 family metallopeptidase [Planctomycetes bacterium]|nr:M56 family metallopeptidase [Planctomycetota bacterium]
MMRDVLQIGLGNALTAAALALGVLAITCVWRRPQAAWLLWTLVLVRLAAPPLVAIPLHADSAGSDTLHLSEVTVTTQSLAGAYRDAQATRANQIEPSALSQGTEISAHPAFSAAESRWLEIVEPIAFFVWIGGAFILSAVIAVRVIRFHRLVLRTRPADAALQQLSDHCAQLLNLRRPPEVRIVEGRVTPLVWAIGRRARVLLPADLLERLDEAQLTALLTHELAHLRRRDPWMRWFEAAAVVLHWWNPVAWWARVRVQQAEEECCDQLVLRTLPGHANAYAEALLETVQFLSAGRTATPMLASGFGRVNLLKRRFEMILQGSRRRVSWPARAALLIVVAAVIPFSAYAAWGEEDEAQLSFGQRLERLEKLVEKLLEREDISLGGKDDENHDTQAAEKRATQERLAELVEDFNKCMDEGRWLEAEVVADRARKLAPDSDLAATMFWRARHLPSFQQQHVGNDESAATEDAAPSQFGDVRRWEQLSQTRRERLKEQKPRGSVTIPKVYSVADLVVPIPGALIGLNEAPADLTAWTLWSHNRSFASQAPTDSSNLDFDSLIKAITSTIEPNSWEESGGKGAIHQHAGNLSLVIIQTEKVHRQIAELLEQMRRLQDVQIVLETRFLEIPEKWLPLGVEFSVNAIPVAADEDDGAAPTGVGVAPVEQKPIQLAALTRERRLVLKDREVRVMLEAAQQHARANMIVAAPKVTLFNGQRAFIQFDHAFASDDPRSPLAKALGKPRPAPRREAISLGLQGVVSNDRRRVRLSAAPLVTAMQAAAAESAAPAPPPASVTANVSAGSALLIDGGALNSGADGREATRLLILVTPRILIAEEEEDKLGIDKVDVPTLPLR